MPAGFEAALSRGGRFASHASVRSTGTAGDCRGSPAGGRAPQSESAGCSWAARGSLGARGSRRFGGSRRSRHSVEARSCIQASRAASTRLTTSAADGDARHADSANSARIVGWRPAGAAARVDKWRAAVAFVPGAILLTDTRPALRHPRAYAGFCSTRLVTRHSMLLTTAPAPPR